MSGRSWSLLLSFHHIILFIMITSISEVWVPRPLSIASRCRAERRREHNNNLSVVINSSNNHNSSSNHNNSKCSNNNRIKCRISSSSFLTRPCALYLFTVLVILDLSDFNSGNILISSFSNNGERTASSRGKSASDNNINSDNNHHEVYNSVVSTMSRYNGFLVNGAFNNKENYYYDHGLLGGLTDSPQVPSLSMDSLFFQHSVQNQLTDSSESAEEQLENISRDEDDEFEDGDENENDRETTDSVEISRTLEPQMLQRLESRFLKLFGMKKRPSAEASNKKQIKIPKYLLDLYQKQTGTELPTSNLNLPGRHTRTANTVRTFYHQQPGNPKESTGPWKGRENHIHFKLDSIPETEKVTGAELRIPFWITVDKAGHSVVSVQSGGSVRESNSVSDDDDRGELKAVRILIHDIMKPAAATEAASRPGLETGLVEPTSYPIDSKNVILSKRRNGTSSFWLTFDVFPAVARWMSNPEKNHGLVLEILGVTNEGQLVPQETVVQRHNLRVKRDVDDNDNHHDEAETESVVHVETSGSSGKGRRTESQSNSIITTDSSSTSSANGSAAPSSKSTQDSGESLSESSKAQTPVTTSSSVVQASSSSSPTEVGVAVAPDGGFINGFNEERNSVKKGKSFEERKKAAASSSSIVLFTYSDDGHNPAKTRDAKTLSRHYRSAQAHKRRKNPRNKNRKRNLCQRHAMFVDFQDVGWNDWIVAPPGYAAYYCAGECPFPMAEHLNATNHAVIQALVHSMNPALVPPPCCVPTKYSSLSLLYTDSSDKIVLKNYNEMVVDSCGCS